MSCKGNTKPDSCSLSFNEFRSDITLQEIDEAETKIRQQREELAKERKKFTEACLDLGKQREELQQAKVEFEEGKRTFTLDKFMSLLTTSPAYVFIHDRNLYLCIYVEVMVHVSSQITDLSFPFFFLQGGETNV